MRQLLTYIFLALSIATNAQQPVLDSLAHGEALPAKLLSTKSLLVFKTLPNPKNPDLRLEWLPLADEIQPYLQRSGIDAVAAYHLGDIFSGKETTEAYMFQFSERAIEHVVVVEQEMNGYRIHVGKFDEETFIDASIPMWSTFGTELYRAGENLYLAASQSGQKLANRLILAVPEIGNLVSPIKGRRSEFYDLNLESDKLAIVPFADTAAISKVMEDYPYKYDYVDPSIPERNLRSDGYQFILYYVHSTGESVREMLEYPTDETEDAYISESFQGDTPIAQNFDKKRPVYKFYVKHIYSGNVFLGQKYDAAPTWEEALAFYIANLREELL
jgi:hypothetical protein